MRFISEHKSRFGVEPICRVLTGHGYKIAPSTNDDGISRENYGVYGVGKVWLALNRDGIAVARCTVERLMGELGLAGTKSRDRPRGSGVPNV